MLETLIADDDFPEDDFSGDVDPLAETVIMESPEAGNIGPTEAQKRILPGHLAHRLLLRFSQGPYTPTDDRLERHWR